MLSVLSGLAGMFKRSMKSNISTAKPDDCPDVEDTIYNSNTRLSSESDFQRLNNLRNNIGKTDLENCKRKCLEYRTCRHVTFYKNVKLCKILEKEEVIVKKSPGRAVSWSKYCANSSSNNNNNNNKDHEKPEAKKADKKRKVEEQKKIGEPLLNCWLSWSFTRFAGKKPHNG